MRTVKTTIIVALTMFATIAEAQNFQVDGICYSISTPKIMNENGVVEGEGDKYVSLVKGVKQYAGNIIIPDTVTYDNNRYPVKSLGYEVFIGNKQITSVTLPNTIESVGNKEFYGCEKLATVNLPGNRISIGNLAFGSCESLTEIIIPDASTILDEAFKGCAALKSLTLPENAFIGENIIDGCNSLKKIIYGEKILTKDEFMALMAARGKVIYTIVDEAPEFYGGFTSLLQYLKDNIAYPQNCLEKKIEGKAFVSFVVEVDGSLSNIEILKSAGDKDLDNEALRVVRNMPKWKPGVQAGKNVCVKFTLPVVFSLQ